MFFKMFALFLCTVLLFGCSTVKCLLHNFQQHMLPWCMILSILQLNTFYYFIIIFSSVLRPCALCVWYKMIHSHSLSQRTLMLIQQVTVCELVCAHKQRQYFQKPRYKIKLSPSIWQAWIIVKLSVIRLLLWS